MKNFFSKIKNGIGKVLTNIKKVFVNLKDKIKNVFNRIRNKNRNVENQEIGEINNNEPIISNENINSISNERQTVVRDATIPMNSDTKFRTTGHDTIVAPIIMNKTQNNNNNVPNREGDNVISQDSVSYSEEVDSTINKENAERIVSIEIKESIGIVEFETITGKKYQKNIEDILSEKKNLYKDWNINKKCNDFAKNKIQALRLRRKLNPVVISTLNNEEDIDNYIKCVNDTEKIWFNLEHDLINSKLKGKNARTMKRVGKHEEKIGAKVKRKESLIERMLKKIKAKNKEPEEMAEEIETLEKDNTELNGIEEEIVTDINEVEDKKSKKEEKLAKKEFKERYASYAALIGSLYGLKPRKKIDDIMNDVVDRDIYNLTDKDAWTRAVATFNVGHRLSMIKPKEAKKYLISAYDQLKNEELLTQNENAFQYLEDTLLNFQELYIRENNFKEAAKLNNEYMRIVEREKKEKINPLLQEYKKNGSQIKEIDLMIEYRKKYVAGQKVAMKMLYRAGHKFEAEELYRKVLNESGIVLTDEAYDLSIKENGIENGKYIVIENGITYREPILGNEKYLSLRNKLTQQLIKDKMNSEVIEPKVQPVATETKVEPKVEPKVQPATTETEKDPSDIAQSVVENETPTETNNTKKKGIIARTKEAIDTITKEKAEKSKEKKAREEELRKQREEQKKKEEEKRRLEEERKKAEEEEKRKLEEQRKAELADFNKKYKDYNVLARGILGGTPKKDIQDIKKDVVHYDIFNMTSTDKPTKGEATFRVGHRLAMLPTMKKEAERLLKSSINILNDDSILKTDEKMYDILEDSYMDLGNLYINNGNYNEAEQVFSDYIQVVKKEKVERYDPLILKARNEGNKLVEFDYWIKYRNKMADGRKAMLKLLCRSGKSDEAEEFYKKLLEASKISLSKEEYELSIETNCIENGQYMRISNGKTLRKPITGSEDLLVLKEKVAQQVVADLRAKQNAALEK